MMRSRYQGGAIGDDATVRDHPRGIATSTIANEITKSERQIAIWPKMCSTKPVQK
jgi:hypothetical protein